MADTNTFPYFQSRKSVLLDSKLSVLDPQVAHVINRTPAGNEKNN
jgi:hypothetical protein